VKDLEAFNISLLAKWRWHFLLEKDALWSGLLRYIFGYIEVPNLRSDNNASRWWRDLVSLDGGGEWFSSLVSRKVGDRSATGFWKDAWVGGGCLMDLFPRPFNISINRDVRVGDIGRWTSSGWVWVWRGGGNFLFERKNLLSTCPKF